MFFHNFVRCDILSDDLDNFGLKQSSFAIIKDDTQKVKFRAGPNTTNNKGVMLGLKLLTSRSDFFSVEYPLDSTYLLADLDYVNCGP